MSDNVNETVAKHNQQIKSLERRMESVETDNKVLSRLTTVLEEQMKLTIERDKEQQERIGKQTRVLDRIDTNLTNLNSRFDHVEDRVDSLEQDKISRLEVSQKRRLVLKDKIIGGIVIGVAVALIVFWLGLK